MKAFHSRFGQVEVLNNENGRVTFLIEETGKEKTMTASLVNLYPTEEAMEEAVEIKEYLKDMEELEEIQKAEAELKALEIEVNQYIKENGGLTFEESTRKNIAKGLY